MIDANDIWEALFGILKGNVPEELTEDVCEQLAILLNMKDNDKLTTDTLPAELMAVAIHVADSLAKGHYPKQPDWQAYHRAATAALSHKKEDGQ